MKQRILQQNVLLAALILAFSGCGTKQQPLNDGVAQGYDAISVANGDGQMYDFYISPEYYGYFTVDNVSGNIRIYAPYGVYMTSENINIAPSEGYTYGEEDLYTGYYYIIRPDSLHYAKLYIESVLYSDTTANIYFQWWLQTQENVREF